MCDSWLRKKEINPLTNRPIKAGSELYRDIENFCGNKDDNCLQIRSNRNVNPLTKKALTHNSKKADLFLGLCDKNKKASPKKSSRKPIPKKSSRKSVSKKSSRKPIPKKSSRKSVSKKSSRKPLPKKVSGKPVSKKVKDLVSIVDIEKEEKNAKKAAKKAVDKEVIENIEDISPLQCTKYKNVTLKEHQTKVCNHIDQNPNNKGMIIFHSVGSGKTLTSITIIRCLLKHFPTKKVFVVTPKSLVDNFKKEVKKVGVDLGGNLTISTHVSFINKIDKEGIRAFRNSIIIIDEAHNFKTKISEKTGKRVKSLMKATAVASHVFLLTATPIFNHPVEFSNLYCMISNNEKNHEKYDEIFLEFDLNKALIRNMLKNKISYFKNEDTTEYPSVTYHNVEFEMTREYLEMYEKIEENLIDEESKENSYFWFNSNDLRKFHNGVRRAVNSVDEVIPTPKVEWVLKQIKDHIKENKKLLLYSTWLKSGITLIQQRLREEGIPFEEIKGDMNIKKRTEAVNKYNSGEIKLLCISSAGGEGLDLKETRSVIIMEPHWNNEKLNQVIGRAVRFRSHITLPLDERHVDIYHLILRKPPDVWAGRGEGGKDLITHPASIDQSLIELSKKKDELINEFYNNILDVSL